MNDIASDALKSNQLFYRILYEFDLFQPDFLMNLAFPPVQFQRGTSFGYPFEICFDI